MTTTTSPRRPTLRSPEDERRFHLAYASLLRERGYSTLARSHEHLAGSFLPDEEKRANLAASWVRAGRWDEETEH